MADSPVYPGAPRWLKIFGIVVFVVVLLLVIVGHLLGFRPHHSSANGHEHSPQTRTPTTDHHP